MSNATPNAVRATPKTVLEAAAVRRRRESTSLAIVACFIIAVLGILAVTGQLAQGLPWTGGLAIFGALFAQSMYSSHSSRCPSCERRLGPRIQSAKFCPQCGTRLMPIEPV